MSDGFIESFVSAGEDGTALANSSSATSIIPASRKILLPAGFFDRVGKQLRVRAAGRISTVVTTPGTLTLDIRLNSDVVFTGGASGTLNTAGTTNLTWEMEVVLTCRAIGTSATVMGIGRLITAALSAATPIMLLPASVPVVSADVFDSTVSNTVDLFATWSVANASNSITLHQFSIESGV